MLNSYFMSWPKEFLLFTVNLPVALSGGHIAFNMGINSFITDISTPEQRTFRMAAIHFVDHLGGPLGTKMGAYLWDKVNIAQEELMQWHHDFIQFIIIMT